MNADAVPSFLDKLPSGVWALSGVILTGFITIGINSYINARRRRAICGILFSRLYSLVSEIRGFFNSKLHTAIIHLKVDSPDRPFLLYRGLFASSTITAYPLVHNLSQNLFIQETNLSELSWVLSKLEVAEAARQNCISRLYDNDNFFIAWYIYCFAMRDLSVNVNVIMMLRNKSLTPIGRIFSRKNNKAIHKELCSHFDSIEKSFGDFENILQKPVGTRASG